MSRLSDDHLRAMVNRDHLNFGPLDRRYLQIAAEDLLLLRAEIEAICQEPATSRITRARLRHAVAGVNWRKAR